MLITSFWVSFIEMYAFLRCLSVWGNFASPLVQIGLIALMWSKLTMVHLNEPSLLTLPTMGLLGKP